MRVVPYGVPPRVIATAVRSIRPALSRLSRTCPRAVRYARGERGWTPRPASGRAAPLVSFFRVSMSSSSADAGAPQAAGRRRLHTRTIVVEVYARDDGLLDLEARLTDVKDHVLPLASGPRPAGEPVHDMHLHLSVDPEFNVVEAGARGQAVPYAGFCDAIGPSYAALKGLNLLKKFRQAVMQAMGGTRGCTHISELAAVLPTAAVQAAAGVRRLDPDAQPFQLDRCHALVTNGEAVRQFYPRWYRGARAGAAASPSSAQSSMAASSNAPRDDLKTEPA